MYAPLGLVCKQIWMFFFLQTQALMVEFTEIKILKKKKCTKAKLAMKVPSLRFKKSNEDKN